MTTEPNDALLQAVYPELRDMAARMLRRERVDHTLQRTALVHEAFVRFFGRRPCDCDSIGAFLTFAARQMRQILIEYGRRRRTNKRGSGFKRIPLSEVDHGVAKDQDSLLALNEVLERLGTLDGRALSIVELKFFCGYSNLETAAILDVSEATVEADWQFARSWLFRALAPVS